MDPGPGDLRRAAPAHRLLPRPRRRHPLRRHLLQRTRRATRGSASRGDGRGRLLVRPPGRPGHLRRLRRTGLVAQPAPRSHHPGRRTGPTSTTTSSPTSATYPLDAILPSTVQAWVTHAVEGGLSARSVAEVPHAAHPGSSPAPSATASCWLQPRRAHRAPQSHRPPDARPDPRGVRHPARPTSRPNIAPWSCSPPRPGCAGASSSPSAPTTSTSRRRTLTVEDVYVEVSKKNSPTGQRMILRHYPKDNEPRTLRITAPARRRPTSRRSRPSASDGRPAVRSTKPPRQPISRSTFRARVWLPAVKPPTSTSTCAGTTSATPTPPGSSPAEPTSKPSWTASATPKSTPPSNTSTPCPTPTTKPSKPSPEPNSAAPVEDGMRNQLYEARSPSGCRTCAPASRAPIQRRTPMEDNTHNNREGSAAAFNPATAPRGVRL